MGDELLAALVAAVTAMIVLAIERRLSQAFSSRELRRRGLEEWLSSLAIWVDEHRNVPNDQAADSLMQKYQQLTNRQVLELRFKREDKYVAWWMHEMVSALLDENPQPSRAEHRDGVLQDTGEALLRWHHGELKSRDFQIPYALRKRTRIENRRLPEVAGDLQLSDYVEPQRMTRKRERHIAKLLSEPESGRPLLNSLGFFAGKSNVVRGRRLAIFGLTSIKFELVLNQLQLKQKNRRLAKLERRLAKKEGRLDAMQGELEKLLHQAARSAESHHHPTTKDLEQ